MDASSETGPSPELTDVEAALVASVLAGEVADLKRRSVRASVIRDLILEARSGWHLPPAGLRVERAVITGAIDLEGASTSKPIIFRHCRLESAGEAFAINVRDAKLRRLGVHASTVEGSIMADRVEVERGLFIGGGRVAGLLQIRGGSVGGALAVEGTEIGDGTSSILAAGCSVSGPLIIRRSKISGEVSFARARLGAGLYGEDLAITAPGLALNGEGARLDGDFNLERSQVTGTLRLSNARIEGRIAGDGLRITGGDDALLAGGVRVSQGIDLTSAQFKGSVWLDGASIGKQINAANATFDGGAMALSADVIEIGGSWEMPAARFVGQLRLTGARVGGQLRMTGAKVFGSDLAIRADGASMGGGCFLAETVIVGLVRFAAADFGNQLRLSGATLKTEEGAALYASGSRFRRDIELNKGFQAVGAVVFDQASIEGALDLRGSHIKSARISRGGGGPAKPVSAMGTASDAITARFDEAAVSVVDARIGRVLMPDRADERPRGVIDLSRAHVRSFEDWAAAWPPDPTSRARCSEGRDIDHLVLDGFNYDHLGNPGGHPEARGEAPLRQVAEERERWLEGQNEEAVTRHFGPQAWTVLRDRLAAQGYASDARALDIALRRRQRRAAGQGLGSKWQSRLLDWLALYGHNPWRTVAWSVAVIFAFSLLWGWAQSHCSSTGCFDERVMVVANRDAYSQEGFQAVYPAFDALAYSLDVFVPFVSLGYEDHWRPNTSFGHLFDIWLPDLQLISGRASAGWTSPRAVTVGGILYALMALEILLGLILTSLMVTGFSGLLLRQD